MEVIRRVWTYEPHALERDGVRECRRLVARYAALGTGLGLAGVGVAMGGLARRGAMISLLQKVALFAGGGASGLGISLALSIRPCMDIVLTMDREAPLRKELGHVILQWNPAMANEAVARQAAKMSQARSE
ncbi:Uncharacterized protein PBTT_02075 [Plasmodiophora brassicae]|uniref:Uncharacterized protein n=1 Tax=Plasmodiophora brassicae TaxID=37360 RepID=A0A0G4J5L2_PLABS|nr:hypothetical protein PBRA_002601 [Plasmodiophora brassicae]SPQ94762.1 unnamed protein product [Plasmodiophora brassicae]